MSSTNLLNRIIDEDGNVIYLNQGLIDYLYKYSKFPEHILYIEDDDTTKYNKFIEYYNENNKLKLPSKLKTHKERQSLWFYPDEYNTIDLEEYFINILKEKNINTIDKKNRVIEELKLYKEKGYEKLLRFCIYFMNEVNKNNWIIGIGRGSSVNSYILYILGLHQVDSIKYDLDIKDFLK